MVAPGMPTMNREPDPELEPTTIFISSFPLQGGGKNKPVGAGATFNIHAKKPRQTPSIPPKKRYGGLLSRVSYRVSGKGKSA
jgi:hypothetical protein